MIKYSPCDPCCGCLIPVCVAFQYTENSCHCGDKFYMSAWSTGQGGVSPGAKIPGLVDWELHDEDGHVVDPLTGGYNPSTGPFFRLYEKNGRSYAASIYCKVYSTVGRYRVVIPEQPCPPYNQAAAANVIPVASSRPYKIPDGAEDVWIDLSECADLTKPLTPTDIFGVIPATPTVTIPVDESPCPIWRNTAGPIPAGPAAGLDNTPPPPRKNLTLEIHYYKVTPGSFVDEAINVGGLCGVINRRTYTMNVENVSDVLELTYKGNAYCGLHLATVQGSRGEPVGGCDWRIYYLNKNPITFGNACLPGSGYWGVWHYRVANTPAVTGDPKGWAVRQPPSCNGVPILAPQFCSATGPQVGGGQCTCILGACGSPFGGTFTTAITSELTWSKYSEQHLDPYYVRWTNTNVVNNPPPSTYSYITTFFCNPGFPPPPLTILEYEYVIHE